MNTVSSILVVAILSFCMAGFACSGNAGNANAGNANAVPVSNSGNSTATPAGSNATAPNEKAAYPQEVADEFMKSCQGAGSDANICSCLFGKIQAQYSLEEFTVMELKLSAGNPPEEFVQFVGSAKAECTRDR